MLFPQPLHRYNFDHHYLSLALYLRDPQSVSSFLLRDLTLVPRLGNPCRRVNTLDEAHHPPGTTTITTTTIGWSSLRVIVVVVTRLNRFRGKLRACYGHFCPAKLFSSVRFSYGKEFATFFNLCQLGCRAASSFLMIIRWRINFYFNNCIIFVPPHVFTVFYGPKRMVRPNHLSVRNSFAQSAVRKKVGTH